MLLLLAIASAKAMLSQGAHALAADAKAKATAPPDQVIGVGPNGAMTDESEVQLRAEGQLDPLGPSAASMLAMPALDDGPVSADIPSLEELEASTTASTTAADLSDAISSKKAAFDTAAFADSMQDLLDVAPAAANTTTVKAPMDADAFAKAAIDSISLPGLPMGLMPQPQLIASDPHGSLSTSALQAKQTAKAAQWNHALKTAAAGGAVRQLSDDDHWATEALRTTGGIVATIDDDYPYQCHCSRKSTVDAVASGVATPVTPGSLSESGRTLAQAQAEATMKTTFSGVCTHHPDQECMAIPGDHAALLSVVVLALLN